MHLIDHRQVTELMLEKIFVFARIAQSYLENKVVFAGKVQADLYLGVLTNGFGEVLQGDGRMRVEFDQRDHQGWSAHQEAVEQSRKATNKAQFPQPAQALTDGGFAFVNGQPDLGRIEAPVLLKQVKDTDISGIELAVLLHDDQL